MNINALETAALDRIRELVRDITFLDASNDMALISQESMHAILEVQEIVNEDLSIDFDVDELDTDDFLSY